MLNLTTVGHRRWAAAPGKTGLRERLGRDSRRAPVLLAVLSVATAVWLGAEAFVIATERGNSWPISAFTMFSGRASSVLKVQLEGETAAGALVALDARGFALRSGQLDRFLLHEVVRRSGSGAVGERPGARRALSRLAAIWNGTHPSARVRRVRLTIETLPIPARSPSQPTRVLRFSE